MPTRTADQAYRARLTEARWLVSRLEAALDEHARAQPARPADWEAVLDLQHTCEHLRRIAASLGARDLTARPMAQEPAPEA